ncbi:MAG: T9SS type A sorting domain-containing protein [bacterium]|nr:T9SS type A sorting domain-containing protein [bacterium]
MHKKLGIWIFVGIFGVINFATADAPDTLWTRTFGGILSEDGYAVLETPDSGFILVGDKRSSGFEDVYLIRTNSSGDTLWTRTYGGADDEWGFSIQHTSDGGFIIAGVTESYGAGLEDVYLIRIDSSGNTLWTNFWGGVNQDYAYSVQQTQDGGFIIAGYTSSAPGGTIYRDVYLIRTNSLGGTLWTKTFGGNSCDEGYSVQETSDNGFIIVGRTNSFGAGLEYGYLIRTNSSGDTIWTRTFGDSSYTCGYSVQQTKDGGFIIAGEKGGLAPCSTNVYLIKTDSSGDTLWTRTYGGTDQDYGRSVQETSDGGFIIAGETYSWGYRDVYLIKTDSLGDTLWTKLVGGNNIDWGYSVRQTFDGGYIIVGVTTSFGAGADDIYLIRLAKEEAGVEEKNQISNIKYQISTYPNPLIQSTVICYSLPEYTNIQLTIHDISGRTLKTLVNGEKEAGSYSADLDAKGLKTGIYFVTLTAGKTKQTKKLILME